MIACKIVLGFSDIFCVHNNVIFYDFINSLFQLPCYGDSVVSVVFSQYLIVCQQGQEKVSNAYTYRTD